MVSPISGLLGSQGKYHYKGSSSDVEKWFTKQNTFLSAFCISTCICMYVIYLWMEKWRKILQRKQLCGQPVSGLFPLHHRAFSRVLLGWEVVCPLLLEAVVPWLLRCLGNRPRPWHSFSSLQGVQIPCTLPSYTLGARKQWKSGSSILELCRLSWVWKDVKQIW